jgi:hypothetical protein
MKPRPHAASLGDAASDWRMRATRSDVMGRLRDKMTGDLKLRGLSDNTRETYLHCVTVFARHHRVSPAKLGREQVRDFLLHLVEQRKVKPSTYNVYGAALKFLYCHTLERPEEVAWIGRMKVSIPWTAPRIAERSAIPGSRVAERRR